MLVIIILTTHFIGIQVTFSTGLSLKCQKFTG